jgi:hypothetical protein
VLVDEPEPTTDESRAAIRFMTYLRQPAQQRLLEKHGFRTDDESVPRSVVGGAGGSSPQPYAEPPVEPASARATPRAVPRTRCSHPSGTGSGRPTGQVCTGSPACISSR